MSGKRFPPVLHSQQLYAAEKSRLEVQARNVSCGRFNPVNSQEVRSCGSTGSSGTAAILPGTGVRVLQFNQHQQSLLPTLPFFM